jgi:hypothetical protein
VKDRSLLKVQAAALLALDTVNLRSPGHYAKGKEKASWPPAIGDDFARMRGGNHYVTARIEPMAYAVERWLEVWFLEEPGTRGNPK